MSTSPPTSITTCPGAGLRRPRVIWSSTSPPRLSEGGSAGRFSRVSDIEAHGRGPVAALPLQTLVLVSEEPGNPVGGRHGVSGAGQELEQRDRDPPAGTEGLAGRAERELGAEAGEHLQGTL